MPGIYKLRTYYD